MKKTNKGGRRIVLVLSIVSLICLSIILGGCSKEEPEGGNVTGITPPAVGQPEQPKVVKIGATEVPHSEILEFAEPLFEKENIKVDVIIFNDYVQPNIQLSDKQLDANFFQHIPYLEDFSAERNLDLTWIAKVHIEPMGIYAGKVDKLDDLKEGDQVGIPNDATNGGRALVLLEKAGLIKLKDGVGVDATVLDIAENPKKLKITELNAEILPRSKADLAVAVINGNFAIQAGLSPLEDALFIEDSDSPFVNVLAVRTADKDDETLKKVVKVLNSDEVRQFILDTYGGGVVPAF